MSITPLNFLHALWESTFQPRALSNYGKALKEVVEPLLGADGILHRLPLVVCQSLQGTPATVASLQAAWSCIYRAAKIFDDLEDGESRLPLAEGINQGLGVLWTAHALLGDDGTGWTPEVRLAVLNRLHPALLRATAGQQLDIEQAHPVPPICTPDEWMVIAEAKSGELLGWATWSSAWVVTENKAVADAFAQFGINLGILLQVVDDFEGVWGTVGKDLIQPTLTLPLCYAMMVADSPTQLELTRLITQARQGNGDAASVLRTRLEAIGTREFLWTVAHHYAQQAEAAVSGLEWVDTSHLRQLLTTIFPPYQQASL
jgi:geranylgeranyl pyrophosphate synthase